MRTQNLLDCSIAYDFRVAYQAVLNVIVVSTAWFHHIYDEKHMTDTSEPTGDYTVGVHFVVRTFSEATHEGPDVCHRETPEVQSLR